MRFAPNSQKYLPYDEGGLIPVDYMEPTHNSGGDVGLRKLYNRIMEGDRYAIDPFMYWRYTREGHAFWDDVSIGETPITDEIKENIKAKFLSYSLGMYDVRNPCDD